jgi:eukaryotic-like serine/threonine-protein kinase
MPPKPLEPGDPMRLGRFELLGRIGEGGQGVVYLGRGAGPGEERVAVKVLRSSVDPVVMARLGRELEAIHQVQPFVTAGVIEASVEGDVRYIVSEFIDGPSLQERVRASGPLREGELQRLAVGTATALTAIHGAGVVHRDFKPANVLLGPDGPRVVDFGIARLTDVATITSGVIGTPSYIAPEQLAGERPTSAVDIFAWAATMIYAATGRMAFSAETVPAMMYRIMNEEPDLTGVPSSLAPLLRQCLAKDPLRRPTARDVLLGIVDPSSRAPLATSFDQPLAAGPEASGPATMTAGTAASRSAATGFTPPQAADAMPWPGPTELSAHATPATLPRPGTPGPRRRRWPVLAAVGGAAVAALVVTGILLFPKSPSSSGNAGPGSGSSPAIGHTTTVTTAASTATAAAVASGPVIPAAFAGKWSGTAMQSAISDPALALSNPVALTLAAGARTAHEENQDCVNTLTLTKMTATTLTFDEPATGSCVAGTVTLTLKGNALAYHWTDSIEQNVGTLRKV